MAATLRSARTRIGPGITGARAALRPWRPATADPGHRDPPPGFEAVDADTLVMEAAPAAPEAQALFRALERAGLAAAVRAPEPRFEGFAWYDRLPRIRSVLTLAVVDGRTCPPHAVPVPEGSLRPPRPEAVSMRLRIAHPAGWPEEMRTVAADLALAGAPGPWAGTARALATPASDLTPGTLARLLRAAFLRPSGDALARTGSARASTKTRCAPHASPSPPKTTPAAKPSPTRSRASSSGCSPTTGRPSLPCAPDRSPSPSAPHHPIRRS